MSAAGRRDSRPTRKISRAVLPAKRGEPTRERRALSSEELDRLCDVAPPYRAIVYLTAAATGFRRGELRSLRPQDLDVGGKTLRLRASGAKNR